MGNINIRRRLHIAIIFAIAFVLTILGAESAFATTGVNVDFRSQDEIRAYFAQVESNHTYGTTYEVEPVTIGPGYKPGRVSNASLQDALNMLNAMRFTAGIPYDVQLNEEYNELCQAGMLINAVNNEMTHKPAQPAGMELSLYQKGYKGCSSSNISGGRSDIYTTVVGWMSDEYNVTGNNLGHRRWCLNPSMQETGFGRVGAFSAMYTFDNWNGSTSYSGVAWPAQQMPLEYFNTRQLWSISFGRYINPSAAKVTLTRESDGATWNFGAGSSDGTFLVENSNFGQTGCVIFNPNGVTSYNDGDIFNVVVRENGGVIADYDVEFFSLHPVTSISINQNTLALEAGKTARLTATVLPYDASNRSVVWTSSNENVATVNSIGTVTAKGEGTAVITAKAAGGSCEATCEVKVSPKPELLPLPSTIKLEYSETIYDCLVKTPSVTISGLKQGKDFNTKYYNNINVGTARVEVTGIGAYTGKATIDFKIKAKTINETDISCTRDKSTGKVNVVINYQNDRLIASRDYTVAEKKSADGKELVITITGYGNYTGTFTKSFSLEITEETPTDLRKLNSKDIKYEYTTTTFDGTQKKPTVSITNMAEDRDFSVSYSNNVNAGTATITVKGIGTKTGTLTKQFNITPKSISTMNPTYTYDRNSKVMTVKLSGLTAGKDFKVTSKEDSNGLFVDVTIEGIGNYTGTIRKNINTGIQKLGTNDFSLEFGTAIYDGTAKTPKVISSLTEGKDYTVEYKNNVNAGDGDVYITGINDYTGSVRKRFTIRRKSIDNNLIIKAYKDGKLSGKIGEMVEGKDYTLTYDEKGSVTVSGIGNYIGKIIFTKKSDNGNTGGSNNDQNDFVVKEEPGNDDSFLENNDNSDLKLVRGVQNTGIKLKSKISTAKGKKAVALTWSKTPRYKVDHYLVYRSTHKSNGFKKAFTTKKCSYKNTKVKSGQRYYYKVRGCRKVDGKIVYTKWSNLAYRTVK